MNTFASPEDDEKQYISLIKHSPKFKESNNSHISHNSNNLVHSSSAATNDNTVLMPCPISSSSSHIESPNSFSYKEKFAFIAENRRNLLFTIKDPNADDMVCEIFIIYIFI
jgi:hypothetical protein